MLTLDVSLGAGVHAITAKATDAAGNVSTASSPLSITVDLTAPTAAIAIADTSLQAGETTTVTITFSEAVVGFSLEDLNLESGSLSNLASSDGGKTWTATLTPTADVTDLTNVIKLGTDYTDIAGNSGTALTSPNFSVETVSFTVVQADDGTVSFGGTASGPIGVAHGEIAWLTSREHAAVCGDGVSTVQQLIDRANQDVRRGKRSWSLMHPLSVNDEAQGLLNDQSIALGDVPANGRIIRLRSAANVSSGGTPFNVAHLAHPDNKALAIRAARLLRLDIAGIDLIMPDISRSWREVGGAICEVNAQPQFSASAPAAPFHAVAGLFAGDGRIPVIVMLGADGFVAAELMLEAFRAQELKLGLALPQHLSVDGCVLAQPAGGAFAAMQALLRDPGVDALVALVDDESWLATGAPVDSVDLLLCAPNASPRMKSLLTPMSRIEARAVGEGQLASRAGAGALAADVAKLRDWHDRRKLPVDRVASAALSASPYCRTEPAMRGSIGLCMIAKDEAAIIRESLDSVRGLVDFVLVEDTGSTDGTQQVVRDWLMENGTEGDVIETPWRDFAWNRTLALAHLRARHEIDYALILDADDVLMRDKGFDAEQFKARLSADIYELDIAYGGLRFSRPQLLRNAKAFGYRGVLHEYVEPPAGSSTRLKAQGLHIQAHSRGARSRNAQKYQDDAALLEKTLELECDPKLRSRYLFYLAQSYEDARAFPQALERYRERAGMAFWSDERFVAAYRAARIQAHLGHPAQQIEAAFREAIRIAPHRKEAYHGLARHLRMAKRFDEAFATARDGLIASQKAAPEGLFVEKRICAHGLLEEAALSANLAGHHRECTQYCASILALDDLPDQVRNGISSLSARARNHMAAQVEPSVQRLAAVKARGTQFHEIRSQG